MTEFKSMPGKKLLVADDSLTIQKVIRLALSQEGYEIEAVSDGKDAAQQIPLFRPDVVLIDVGLPQRSAYDIKREWNRDPNPGHARFILMSSAFEPIDEKQVSQLGFHGRLVKPFDPAHLRKILQDVLAHHVSTPVSTPAAAPSKPAPPFEPLEAVATDDIRALTESTIKMSGLESMDWNLNESARSTPAADRHWSHEGVQKVGETTYSNIQIPDPVIRPSSKMTDLEDVKFDLNQTTDEPSSPASYYYNAPESLFEEPTTQPKIEVTKTSGIAPGIAMAPPAISPDQLEEVVRKVVQKQLPEIAERIIKQEIDRLLSEPPR